MNSTRLLAVLFAVMLAAGIVHLFVSGDDEPKKDDAAAVPAGERWDLHEKPAAPAALPEDLADPEQLEQLMEHERGTPVEPGQEVSLDVIYVPGTVSRYRSIRTTTSTRRADDAVAANRYSEGLEVTVLEPDAKGRTRLRVEQQWFLMQMLAGPRNSWEYDSRSPDEILLAAPHVAAQIKPLLAIKGLPLVYTLDNAGYPIAVEGMDRHRERWREALEQLGMTRVDDFLPADDQRLMRMRGTLCPPGLGGTLVAGKTRDYARREDTNLLTYITFDGDLHVTHADPGTFAVQVRDAETGLERTGRDTLPGGQQIADVRVLPNGSCDASWVFERKPGRLRSARIHIKYEFWVSFPSTDAAGARTFDPHYLRIEQLESVDLLEEASPDQTDDESAEDADSATEDARKPVDTGAGSGENDAAATPK